MPKIKIVGNDKEILYSNGEVYAKTDPNSKAFPNEEIRK